MGRTVYRRIKYTELITLFTLLFGTTYYMSTLFFPLKEMSHFKNNFLILFFYILNKIITF